MGLTVKGHGGRGKARTRAGGTAAQREQNENAESPQERAKKRAVRKERWESVPDPQARKRREKVTSIGHRSPAHA